MSRPPNRAAGDRQRANHASIATVPWIAAVAIATMLLGGTPALASQHPLRWEARDCDLTIVLVPTSRETIQPHLPDGFTPVLPDEAAQLLPPDPRMEAVFGYEVFDCAEQIIGQHRAEEISYASLWTFVQPPQRLADPDHPLAFIKWTTLVPDPEQRRLLRSLRVPVTDGSADLTGLLVTPAGATYDVTFTMGPDQIDYRTSGASNRPINFEGRFIEYSRLTDGDGFARWRTDFTAGLTFGGTAAVRWEEDAFAARVLGTTHAQAWVLAGSGLTFSDGSITVTPHRDSSDRNKGVDPDPDEHQQSDRPQRDTDELPASGGGASGLGLLLPLAVLLHDRDDARQ